MATYDKAQLVELLYQMLETELGGEQIYITAISCAVNADLKKEWQDYLKETRHHQEVVLGLFAHFGLDPKASTPGREVVAHNGKSLVQAMELAKAKADKSGAQLVACECVLLAETKDHGNWEMLGRVAEKSHRRRRQGAESRARRSRGRRVPTSTTTPAGAANCGSKAWACPPCCRRRKKRRMSKPRLARAAPSRRAAKCFDRGSPGIYLKEKLWQSRRQARPRR